MTPEQVANRTAPHIVQGMVKADDPEAFWLDLLNRYVGFAEAAIGEEATERIIATLKASIKH